MEFLLLLYDKALENWILATGRYRSFQYLFIFTFLAWISVFMQEVLLYLYLRIHEPLFAISMIVFYSNY